LGLAGLSLALACFGSCFYSSTGFGFSLAAFLVVVGSVGFIYSFFGDASFF
jgi:hypothetical protein